MAPVVCVHNCPTIPEPVYDFKDNHLCMYIINVCKHILCQAKLGVLLSGL